MFTRSDCNVFSRDDTKIVKAIAIILMLMHHLWGFPNRICGGELKHWFSLFNESLPAFLGANGKFCVSLFFFLGGYGLYMSFKDKEYDIIAKLKTLYISYWKIFVIFIPIGFIFFSKQPIYCKSTGICTKFASFNWKEFINNFLGISSTYNGEWWFFFAYIKAMIIFPLVRILFKRFSFSVNFFFVIVLTILYGTLLPALGKLDSLGKLETNHLYAFIFLQTNYVGCFFMGMAMAQSDMLVKIQKKMNEYKLLNPIISCSIVVLILYLRRYKWAVSMDGLFTPFFCVAVVDIIRRLKFVKIAFVYMGHYSTNMWLLHSFFCYYFYPFAKFITFPKYALPSLILLIMITLLASVATEYFYKGIDKLWLYLKSRLNKNNEIKQFESDI